MSAEIHAMGKKALQYNKMEQVSSCWEEQHGGEM